VVALETNFKDFVFGIFLLFWAVFLQFLLVYGGFRLFSVFSIADIYVVANWHAEAVKRI